jgi:hypothetical protein
MNNYRYNRVSISLDRNNHERCRVMASERATSISGLLRALIMDAYEKREHVRKEAPDL